MSRLSNLTDSNITKRIEQVSLGLLFIVLCFGLLPFLYLSVFTQPGAEDIAEALIKDIPWHIKYLYLSYDGRYFAALLYALNPVKQQLFFVYKLIPVALIAALMHASYKLFSALFTIEKKHYGICLSALFVLVYISGVPETSYSLYYMISSIVYTLPIIMSMYLIYFTLRLFSAESKRETWNILLISLLIFFIAGTNEEYLIPLCLYVFSIMLGNWYWKLGKKYEAILFSVVLSISLFLVFTSP